MCVVNDKLNMELELVLSRDSALAAIGLERKISEVKNQHNGNSSIYAVKCWRIPLCVKKYIGKFLYSCWKVLETSTVDIGMCWKLPL